MTLKATQSSCFFVWIFVSKGNFRYCCQPSTPAKNGTALSSAHVGVASLLVVPLQ